MSFLRRVVLLIFIINGINAKVSQQQRLYMTQLNQFRASCIKLRAQNEILRAELEEAQERESRLKEQIDIMSQLHGQQPQASNSSLLQQQIDRLRQQLIACLNQKQQLQMQSKGYRQKIQDLKYHNGQLKLLNQKMSHLHQKEISMLKKQQLSSPKIQQLQKQKNRLQRQLQEVAKVAQEMEKYYIDAFKQQKEVIQCLKGDTTERANQIQHYQLEIKQLKAHIKLLMERQQYQQETVSKPSLGAMSAISADMIQSKMMQSNSSIDSFRVTPSSMTSKQNLTRRNTSGAKTPSKYSMTHRHTKNVLHDKNF